MTMVLMINNITIIRSDTGFLFSVNLECKAAPYFH